MCTRAPASRASSASRATIDSSAARGQPASPSRAAFGPSCATAPTVSRGSSACWAISTPRPVAYSSARRITSGSCTQMPSSENIRTCAAPAAISPISVSWAPASPTVTAPDRVHVDQPDLLAAVPDVVGDHRAVGHRIGVGHREDRGVTTQCRCRRTGFDVLGVLAAGFAQMGVQIDEAGQQHLAGRVDDVGVVGNGQARPDRGDLPVVDEHVDRLALPVRSHAADQHRSCARPPPRLRPADGTAPPSARAPRWKPVAAQPIATSPPPRTRSPCRAASARGAAPPHDRAAWPGAARTARRAPSTPAPTGRTRRSSARPAPAASTPRRRVGSSASRSWDTVTGQPATPTGSRVGGATSTTSAPRVCSSSTLERATRLCRTSPTITTRLPSIPPSRWRMVSASSSAWVGCSWVPSPALMTLGPPSAVAVHSASCWAAPDAGCRMISASAPAARRVSAVSRSDSPLATDDPEALTLITSALIHLPATSNDTRVRVEFS